MNNVQIPWVEKYRPTTLDDLILQPSLKQKIEEIIEKGSESLPNFLFIGPAGTGKTTLAKVIAETFESPYLYINMSEEGNVETMRTKVKAFASTASIDDKIKIIIGDEADGISSAAQNSFRAMQEMVVKNTRFIFTCNYPEKITKEIKSRLKEVYFSPVDEKLILKRVVEILRKEKISTPKEQIPNLVKLIKKYYPDFRKTINDLQYSSTSGILSIDFNELQNEDVFQNFCNIVKIKKLSELRELLKNNRIDYDGIIRQVFNLILNNQDTWQTDENKKAQIIILCGEYLHRSLNFVTDKEVNFTAWAIELMQIIGG